MQRLSSIFALVAATCAHRPPPAPQAAAAVPAAAAPVPAQPMIATTDARGCPMELPGAKVAMSEVDGAIALDFTTPGDVLELRRRVRQLGDRAELADLDNGARVTFAPSDPRQYEDLVLRVQRAVFELNQGDCSSLVANGLALPGPNIEIKAERVPPRLRQP